MDENDFKSLEERYLLIKRNKIFALLGGIFAFFIAAGFLSYTTILDQIKKRTGQEFITQIQENFKKSNKLIS